MAQFKVGGKVVAIESRILTTRPSVKSITIKRGDTFTVKEIVECSCGSIALDVGFSIPEVGKRTFCKCGICGNRRESRAWYIRSTTFVPLDETEFKQIEYTKILEQIPACAQ